MTEAHSTGSPLFHRLCTDAHGVLLARAPRDRSAFSASDDSHTLCLQPYHQWK
jgi:hypothetical protein